MDDTLFVLMLLKPMRWPELYALVKLIYIINEREFEVSNSMVL